jgi:F420-dependent oxidoreductase-like protein
MRIGLSLPHYESSWPEPGQLTWERLAGVARDAEALGFDSLWISDHFFLSLARYGGPKEPQGSVEPFTALAALATLTERVRLGTLVACAPFRHPGILAKMATVIDLVSDGRFDLGIGAGWYEDEFRAFGYPFPSTGERFDILEEQVEAIVGMLSDGPVDFDGKHVHLSGALNLPGPAQKGGPPVWIGSKGGDRSLRLAARHAAGWNTVWKWTPDAHAERVQRLHEMCELEDRDPTSVRLSVGLHTLVGRNGGELQARYQAMQEWSPGGALNDVALEDFAEDTLTGPPDVCLRKLSAFARNGVEEVIVAPASLPFAFFDWSMVELIAEELIPAAHEL